MSSTQANPLPKLTFNNWYTWEQLALNSIGIFGEAGKSIITGVPYVLIEPSYSPMVPYKERYVDPADGLTKLRMAEREWSDDHDWTALSRQESEYKTQSAQFQSQRQSLWSYFMTHIDDEVDNEIKVHQSYAVAHQAFDTSTLWIILRQAALTHGSKHSGIRHQWSNYKQSTYDSAGNVLSTIPMAKYLLRFQGFLDQMKGHPEQPTDAEASDMLLNGINCVRSSTSIRAPIPNHLTLLLKMNWSPRRNVSHLYLHQTLLQLKWLLSLVFHLLNLQYQFLKSSQSTIIPHLHLFNPFNVQCVVPLKPLILVAAQSMASLALVVVISGMAFSSVERS
jgi:hypothetical protein